jgi:alpha-mannosidase II
LSAVVTGNKSVEVLRQHAEGLLESYKRTAMLTSDHNVIMVSVAEDFGYKSVEELRNQFTSYELIAKYINKRKEVYKAELVFGTPDDFFQAVRERQSKFPTLQGDFFPYEMGNGEYWTGYYTTRPFLKVSLLL